MSTSSNAPGWLLALVLGLLVVPGIRPQEAAPGPVEPARKVGELEGTVNEDRDGYPYEGSRTGGHVSVKSTTRSNLRGSAFELQIDDTIPRSLILQDFRFWLGKDGKALFDLEWESPTETDSRFRGIYRDLRNADLWYRRFESTWYDRPREQPSTFHRDAAGLRLRKWADFQLDVRGEDAHEERFAMVRDRVADWNRLELDLKGLLGDVRADAFVRTTAYDDARELTDGYEDVHLRLRLGRDIGPDTHLRATVQTDERTLTRTGETQRDLAIGLSTRTYDLFRNRGLKLLTEARYVTRPSSFQRTQDDDQSLRLGVRLAWDTGAGAFEGGYRQVQREVLRLTRRGVEALLQDPNTPLATLRGLSEESSPETRDQWIKGTMPVLEHKVRLFARLDETATDAPSRTNWTRARTNSLEYTNRRRSRFGVSVFPVEGVDLRAERQLEQRFLAGRGDHFAGQDQRVEHSYVNLHLAFLPRTDLNFQASNFDVHHVDDVVQRETVDEVANYALDLGYELNRTVTLETSYQRLNHDGANAATQELVGFALDYGGTGRSTHFRLDYVLDDFFDEGETSSSYRARMFSLSATAKF